MYVSLANWLMGDASAQVPQYILEMACGTSLCPCSWRVRITHGLYGRYDVGQKNEKNSFRAPVRKQKKEQAQATKTQYQSNRHSVQQKKGTGYSTFFYVIFCGSRKESIELILKFLPKTRTPWDHIQHDKHNTDWGATAAESIGYTRALLRTPTLHSRNKGGNVVVRRMCRNVNAGDVVR